jgi:hypothetical protein
MSKMERFLLSKGRYLPWLVWGGVLLWLLLLGGRVVNAWHFRTGLLVPVFLVTAGAMVLTFWVAGRRERWIREGPLPLFLKRQVRTQHPHLTAKDVDLVERGLRQYFYACSRSGRQFVAMPSQAVDAMWHAFILHTRLYRDWCDLALGRFLHHTPAEALGQRPERNDGLRRAWYWACKDEAINPRTPTRLPLLFALDGKLAIPGGFLYTADCNDIRRKSEHGGDGSNSFCGTDFSDGSASGDSGSFGGADSSGADGGDGGGDGGGGCGGGD